MLKRELGPWTLWGLGVGYVISGMYFGWNLGLPAGGPFGLLAALVLVTVLYISFCFSYAELACAMPKAGGAFVFAKEAFGTRIGFLVGISQWVEFVFIAPAVSKAIGDYFSAFFPGVPSLAVACAAYVAFTGLNVYGVKHSAVFELLITSLAVVELFIFAGVTAPHFRWAAFSANVKFEWWEGLVPAIPFAIWFYVGIEGLANVAEETADCKRDLPKGFALSILTLIALALMTFFCAVGINGWETVVYKNMSLETSDSPLPLALRFIVGDHAFLYHLLISIGLCGLIASFHGTLLAAGRATFEFGRAGFAPAFLGRSHPSRHTPSNALVANLVVGLIAVATGRTGDIIVISVFGALTLISFAMAALLKLRKSRPDLDRPYRAPYYPWLPALACVLSTFCLATMAYYNGTLFLIYLGILALGFAWLLWFVPKEVRAAGGLST